jgi:hypothetical protein
MIRRWPGALISVFFLASAHGAEPRDSGTGYLFAGKMYDPGEYCEFGGGIPTRYVELCEKLRPRSRQAMNARADRSQRWVQLKAANGAIFAVDVGDVGHPEGQIVAAKMCQVDVDGRHCIGGDSWILAAKLFWFDCQGRYADVTNTPSVNGWQPAPPDSVIGHASALVCDQNTLPSK